jgi:CDP-glucose 4,6-dehydratase
MNPEFWKGKRVLLTGHTGFKGAWLSLWLHRLGAEVTGYSLPAPTNPSLYELAGVEETLENIRADVRDFDTLQSVVGREKWDVVFHLAAQSLVRVGYADPLETYSTNVMGTVNLLEACWQCDTARAVVIVTTDKCYRNRETAEGYREDDPMGGVDPYSCSKGCAELVTASYRMGFFASGDTVQVASARAGNVVGGGDYSPDRLVPDCIRSLTDRRPIVIRYPDAVRPWQFVLEPLEGYLLLAERLYSEGNEFADAWNFGPAEGDLRRVREVAEAVVGLWDEPVEIERNPEPQPHEAGLLMLNSDKAREKLSWRPPGDLDATLRWTVDWYRRVRDGQNPRTLCEETIEQYVTNLSP